MTTLLSLLFAMNSMAATCTSEVRSAAIQSAVKDGLESILNRGENAHENPLALIDYTAPKICSYRNFGDLAQMHVSTTVTVEEYYEEGGIETKTDTCHVFLEKLDGVWSANQLICEDLYIDEEV